MKYGDCEDIKTYSDIQCVACMLLFCSLNSFVSFWLPPPPHLIAYVISKFPGTPSSTVRITMTNNEAKLKRRRTVPTVGGRGRGASCRRESLSPEKDRIYNPLSKVGPNLRRKSGKHKKDQITNLQML